MRKCKAVNFGVRLCVCFRFPVKL